MIEVTDGLLLAVVIGLVALANGLGLPKRFSPVVAVVLGVSFGVVYLTPGNVKLGVLAGIVLGLSAVGLYSGTKNMLGK
jgi:EamA domain-containing membrane protein RarD